MGSGSFLHTGGVGSPGEARRRRETGKDHMANDAVAALARIAAVAVGWLYWYGSEVGLTVRGGGK